MRVYPNIPKFNNLGFNNTDNGIGTIPTATPDSFELSLLGLPNRLDGGYYISIPVGSNTYGILLAFDGTPDWSDPPEGLTGIIFADPGDVSDSTWTPRIENLVGNINLNSANLKYTASSANPSSGKLIINSTILDTRVTPFSNNANIIFTRL